MQTVFMFPGEHGKVRNAVKKKKKGKFALKIVRTHFWKKDLEKRNWLEYKKRNLKKKKEKGNWPASYLRVVELEKQKPQCSKE